MLYWFAEFPLNLWSRLIVTVTQYLRSLSLGSKINLAPGLRGLRTSCREGMVEPLMSWWTASRERWYRKGQSKIQLQWFSFSWVPPIKASRICQNSATYQLGTSFPVGITFSKVIYKSRSSLVSQGTVCHDFILILLFLDCYQNPYKHGTWGVYACTHLHVHAHIYAGFSW